MIGDGACRPRLRGVAGKEYRKPKTRPRRAILAVLLASVVLAFLPVLTSHSFHTPAAWAASKKEKKDKDKGNGNDKGNTGAINSSGNGGSNGNGSSNGAGNGKKSDHGSAVDNGITNGNGLAIGLSEGVGLGVGVGDDDTIGVGIGVNLDEHDRKNRSLESTDGDTGGTKWGKTDRNDWSPGKGAEKNHKSSGEDIDFGKQLEVDRIQKGLGSDLNELGKLLTDGDADGKGVLPGHDEDSRSTMGKQDAADVDSKAAGKGDFREKATKADGSGDSKVTGSNKAKDGGGDKALAKAESKADKEERKAAKAEAKEAKKEEKEAKKAEKKASKNKGTDEAADEISNASQETVGRDNPSGGGTAPVSPGSYVAQEVLALGLSSADIGRVRQLGFGVSETGLEQQTGTLLTLSTPTGTDSLRAITLLRRELPRDVFHLNRIYRPYNTATDDPGTEQDAPPVRSDPGGGRCVGDKCYGKGVIGWQERLADCARHINIGVIDTDVDLRHPTFAGQRITRKAFIVDGRQSSANGHGTGVLALLAGRRDSNTPGLIPEAQFFFANIFFTDTNGETITDTVSLLKALDWMSTSQARVVNMSFSGPEDELVQVRLKAMRAQGFAFTAAAGNQGPAAAPSYPAAYSEVVAVTAIGKDMRVYPSANRGQYVDVAAPGVRIWTAAPGAKEGYRTGTSFATPFATAILALQGSETLSAPEEELLDHMRTTELGPNGRDAIYGRGLLQAPEQCAAGEPPIAVSAPAMGSIRR